MDADQPPAQQQPQQQQPQQLHQQPHQQLPMKLSVGRKETSESVTSGDEEVFDEPSGLAPRPSTTLNLTGAIIRDSSYPGEAGDDAAAKGAPSIVLPHQEASYVRHIALDIGGSLIKLVYFSPDNPDEATVTMATAADSSSSSSGGSSGGVGAGSSGQRGGGGGSGSSKGGRMHFVKFETARIQDCLDFIQAKGLHRRVARDGSKREVRVKATGGGAMRFGDVFKERLGLVLEREDEIGCAVGGCNFLLRTITHEAFVFEAGQAHFVPCSSVDEDIFPYLLVNIGSGVSIIRVDGPGEGQFSRVSGSSVGGGTFWGLCRLLTGLRDFDEMLQLSMQGNNAQVDMLVGDIYGGRDYASVGLSASTIASSFGKVVGQDKELNDYNPADVAMSLCRMVAYNIGQLAYMHAKQYDLKRVFFGGFFIRGHPYTMETISFAIKFWSQGKMSALFLRHEGFLGAVGAFLKVHPMHVPTSSSAAAMAAAVAAGAMADGGSGVLGGRTSLKASDRNASTKVRARFVERFSMGAPFAGGEVRGPAIRDMSDRVSWVEKFVAVGKPQQSAAQQQQQQQQQQDGQGAGLQGVQSLVEQRASAPGESTTLSSHPDGAAAAGGGDNVVSAQPAGAAAGGAVAGGGGASRYLDRSLSMPSEGGAIPVQPTSPTYLPARIPLHVGVLHYSPTQEPFPLLADPESYHPNTIDINTDDVEYNWLLGVLEDQVPTVVDKAIKSEGGGQGAVRRAAAFARAFCAHIQKLRQDPGAYGKLGLSDLFEMREECLREFGFSDVYRLDKQNENNLALQVLPDLLSELDAMDQQERLLSLVQGILAANIFDWGAKACVELYTNGTILDIFAEARQRLSRRPWRVDDFDEFAARVYGPSGSTTAAAVAGDGVQQPQPPPAASTAAGGVAAAQQQLQGLNLVGHQRQQQQQQAPEAVSEDLSPFKVTQQQALSAGGAAGAPTPAAAAAGGSSSSSGQKDQPPFRRVMVFVDNAGADIVLGILPFVREMLRLGCEVVMVANSLPAINDITAAELRSLLLAAGELCPIIKAARAAAQFHEVPNKRSSGVMGGGPTIPPYPGLKQRQSSHQDLQSLAASSSGGGGGCGSTAATAATAAAGSSSSRGQLMPVGGRGGGSGSAAVTAFGSPLSSLEGAGSNDSQIWANSQHQQQQPLMVLTRRSSDSGDSGGIGSSSSEDAQEDQEDAAAAQPPGGGQQQGFGGGGSSGGSGSSVVEPKLFVLGNGSGSPCLDLSRVPAALADATVGVDLLVIEGMGRAIHTNLRTRFKCDTLKLAMIKTERLAVKLFGGSLYDCMCGFQAGGGGC